MAHWRAQALLVQGLSAAMDSLIIVGPVGFQVQLFPTVRNAPLRREMGDAEAAWISRLDVRAG